MYIPTILIKNRILGKDRIEPCKCGHYHIGKEEILPEATDFEKLFVILEYIPYFEKVVKGQK